MARTIINAAFAGFALAAVGGLAAPVCSRRGWSRPATATASSTTAPPTAETPRAGARAA